MSLRKLLCAVLVAGWFAYFTLDSLRVRFAPDDMMNLAGYWRMKPAMLAASHVLLWRDFYRPMGGVFYLPLFHAFGLNPAPFHAAILCILLFNVWLVYRLAVLLRAGEAAATLAALVSCYHAGLSNLAYNIAFVYDVLCGCFYLGAFVYYVRVREAKRPLGGREIAVFLVLYLCALNSKEMAVTLPVVLLVYEWLYHGAASLRGPVAAALLNLPYIYGKALRPGALASDVAYHPEFSAARLLEFQTRSFGELFYQPGLSGAAVAWIWAALFYLAFRRPRPVLQFCCIFLAIAPLPIEFLPGRGGACLYLPFVGCAIFASVVCVDVAKAAAEFMALEPLFARLGRQRAFALLLAGCVSLWGRENQRMKQSFVRPAMEQTGALTADVIRQVEALAPRAPSQGLVVFLDDPFTDWDMAFIAELWFRDRTVSVKLQRKTPLSADELARADRVFDFQNGRLVQVR